MVGIYFSGTGNSRYAAELFCKEYDEATKAFSLEDDNITRVVKNEETLLSVCYIRRYFRNCTIRQTSTVEADCQSM